jgi:hypothetical protein
MKFTAAISLLILFQLAFASDECLNTLRKDKKLNHLAFEFEKTGEMNNERILGFFKSSERYPPFKKIKHIFDSRQAKIQFVEKNKNKKCQKGVLAFFEEPNDIFMCIDPEQTKGRLLDIMIHEVLHFYQHKRFDVKDFFYFNFNGEEGVLTKALDYTLDARKHAIMTTFDDYHEASLKLFNQEQKKNLESIFEELQDLSKYFLISDTLEFEVKKPSLIHTQEAAALIPESVLIDKDAVKIKLTNFVKDLSADLRSRVFQMIKNKFVSARFLGPVQIYCYEVQANILSAALNYSRFNKVKHIPECLKLFPQVNPNPIKDFKEFNELIAEAGREYVSRLEKYGKEFSPSFGFKGFEKIFSIDGCGKGEIP